MFSRISLPASFKSRLVSFLQLLQCCQGAVESSAEFDCFRSCETVATIFFNMKNSSVSATYIEFCYQSKRKKKKMLKIQTYEFRPSVKTWKSCIFKYNAFKANQQQVTATNCEKALPLSITFFMLLLFGLRHEPNLQPSQKQPYMFL